MAESFPDESGLLASARRMGSAILGLLHTRAESFSVELQEEKVRAIHGLAWLGLALTLTLAGVLVLMGSLSLFCWEVAGYPGLVALGGLALLSGLLIVWRVYCAIVHGRLPFTDTVAEFKKDADALRGER